MMIKFEHSEYQHRDIDEEEWTPVGLAERFVLAAFGKLPPQEAEDDLDGRKALWGLREWAESDQGGVQNGAALTKEPGMKIGTQQVPYDLIIVEWIDASRLNNGWMDLSDVPDPHLHRCVSVGFAISRNEEALIIVPTIADLKHASNTHTYGGMMIPKASIVSEKILR